MKQGEGAGGGQPDPDQLREEIAQTREQLGETVEALAAKADVKAQAKERVEEGKEQAKAKVAEVGGQVRERQSAVMAIAGGCAALLLLIWLLRRR